MNPRWDSKKWFRGDIIFLLLSWAPIRGWSHWKINGAAERHRMKKTWRIAITFATLEALPLKTIVFYKESECIRCRFLVKCNSFEKDALWCFGIPINMPLECLGRPTICLAIPSKMLLECSGIPINSIGIPSKMPLECLVRPIIFPWDP